MQQPGVTSQRSQFLHATLGQEGAKAWEQGQGATKASYYPPVPHIMSWPPDVDSTGSDQHAPRFQPAPGPVKGGVNTKGFTSPVSGAPHMQSSPVAPSAPTLGAHDDKLGSSSPYQPIVRMTRRDAWARLAAFEAGIQVCLKHASLPEAQHFMADGFARLRDDLAISGLLLSPAPLTKTADTSTASGPELLWDDQAESGSASSSSAGASNEAAMPPGALVSASEASEVIQQDCAKPEEGPLRLDAHTIYETALQCAFAAENCSSTKLETSGPWTWLLYTFAEQYGVRPFFCVLCHLRWVLRPGIATTSFACLHLISEELGLLYQQRHRLSQHEVALLQRMSWDVEELLRLAFETYSQLVSVAEPEHGEGEGGSPLNVDALKVAVQLYHLISEDLVPNCHDWLVHRWQAAARKDWELLRAKWMQADPQPLLELVQVMEHQRDQDRSAGPQAAPAGALMQAHKQYQHRRALSTMQQPASASAETKAERVYRGIQHLCDLIKADLAFDLQLKYMDDLLPAEPELPTATAEHYCAQFLAILRTALAMHPPTLPTPSAVDLLVAVAEMQQYLEVSSLNLDVESRSHLDALSLWRPHVNGWILSSQQRLTSQLATLKQQNAAAAPAPSGASSPASLALVMGMLAATDREMGQYQRVVEHWPAFAQPLEGAICSVLRDVLAVLLETSSSSSPAQTQSPAQTGSATIPDPAPAPKARATLGLRRALNGSHSRAPSVVPAGSNGSGAPGNAPCSPPVPTAAALQADQQQPALITVHPREAAFLNALAAFMEHVPAVEDALVAWTAEKALALARVAKSAGQKGSPAIPDEGPVVGAQLAQVVKELRTHYAAGITACATRLADQLQGREATRLRRILSQAAPPRQELIRLLGVPNTQQATLNSLQQQWMALQLGPLLRSISMMLTALRGALDARVFVASARALWDCVGKELFEFVDALQEDKLSGSMQGIPLHTPAWQARQYASVAVAQVDDLFRQALGEALPGTRSAVGKHMEPPTHVERVHKLLLRSTAAINVSFTPL